MESDVSKVEGLPLQVYDPRRETLQIDRLGRLMIAILVDAVRCFEPRFGAHQPVTRQEFAEVHRPGEASRNGLASARTQAQLLTLRAA